MKPTAKHNDEELRELLLQLRDISTSLFPKLGLRVMNEAADEIERLLASLELARADTRRMDWLLSPDNRKIGVVDDVTEKWIYHREAIDAAIDRAATSAQGEATRRA